MSDPGDIASGSDDDRASVLRKELTVTVLMLREDMGFPDDQIADEMEKTVRVLRHRGLSIANRAGAKDA